jgi:hypothetical protein
MLMELFRLLGVIAIDNTEANNAIDATSQRANDSASETESAFAKIGGAAKTFALGIGTVGLAVGGAFVAAVEGTREYRQQMGLLDSAFQTSGLSSEAAKDTYSELNAVLGDTGQAVEASQHLAKIADNEAELSELTHTLTGVYATFGESLPLEGLAEGINHSAKLGEVQGSLADALEWSGITVEDFNAQLALCSSEEERQKLITDTLKETYSEAANQYKETNKDIMASRQAQERLTDAMAEVGRVGEPIMTAIKNAIASMAEKAVPLIVGMIDKFRDMASWVKNNEDTIHKWVGVIVGATTAIGTFLLIISWGKIMTAAANAVKIVRTAILAMNAAMLANPIGLVVALIVGLVAGFIYLWNNCDGFREFWLKLWDKIKSATSTATKWIADKFDDLKDGLKKVKTIFGDIQKTISEKMESARKKVKDVIDKIKGFFNITLKFKGLKMPSISLTMVKGKGIIAKAAELLGLDGVPKFSVKWNAEGAILDNPTIFGRVGNTLLGGGEAGMEAVTPIDVLQDYVRQSVREENNQIISVLIEQNGIMMDFLEKHMPREVLLDSGALVGELAEPINKRLGTIYNRNIRGNTI